MRIKRNGARRWGLLLAAVISINTLATVTPAPPAQAADPVYCQCVAYVKTRFVLNGHGDAWQWEALLPGEGFTKMSAATARVGDIVVWDYYEEPSVGHIAVVQGIYPSSQGLAMSFRGANQRGNPKFTQNGCNNVSDWLSTTAWATASFFRR